MSIFSTGWGSPSGGGFIGNAKASEPISSRASDYNSPGDNSSPAGKTIPAGSGSASYDGNIVWWSGFAIKNGKVTASFVMLFKDCLFAPSFSLVKLFADEQAIISNVAPRKQSSQKIRFYDGTQTTPDPLLLAALGTEKATAWPGFVYAVFEDFDCSPYGNRVPLIRAVLSGAVTQAAATEGESTLTFGPIVDYINTGLAADMAKGHVYQVFVLTFNDAFVSVIDLQSNAEISRAHIFVRGATFDLGPYNHKALPGSDFVACETSFNLTDHHELSLLNVMTGEIVARLDDHPRAPQPTDAVMIENGASTKYLIFCQSSDGLMVAVADVSNMTLAWVINPGTAPAGTAGAIYSSLAFGPVEDGSVTVYWTERELEAPVNQPTPLAAVRKAVISATGFVESVFYTEAESGKFPVGVAYDQVDDGVVISRENGTYKKILANGTVSYASIAATVPYLNWQSDTRFLGLSASLRPGYAVGFLGSYLPGNVPDFDVYVVDLADASAVKIFDADDISWEEHFYYDQLFARLVEPSVNPGQVIVHSQGDMTPNTVDLVDIFTQIAGVDGRFDASQLVFNDFPGNACAGLEEHGK
ncbi:hypothetical protein [Mesorhizobium sp. WSM3626]|uniref:hypothetical protein n=1 Tax=Mesorhizobium sp. WSM3626 TaxID=1040987 RepID=UPI00048A3D96|nr:hypothetical protein [Mesorhizobium sp. WSM3626]